MPVSLVPDRTPVHDGGTWRLLSLCRLCRAQNAGAVFPRGFRLVAEEVSAAMYRRASSPSTPPEGRLRLLSALYGLENDTLSVVDHARLEAWDTLADEVIGAVFSSSFSSSVQLALCRCLADYFYFSPSPGEDPWFRYLESSVSSFASACTPSGVWPGLPVPEALERIEVMNRYSGMFLDRRHDGAILSAYRHYSSLALSGDVLPLSSLGLLHDLCSAGNACPPDAVKAVRALSRLESSVPCACVSPLSPAEADDASLYVLSYRLSSSAFLADGCA